PLTYRKRHGGGLIFRGSPQDTEPPNMPQATSSISADTAIGGRGYNKTARQEEYRLRTAVSAGRRGCVDAETGIQDGRLRNADSIVESGTWNFVLTNPGT